MEKTKKSKRKSKKNSREIDELETEIKKDRFKNRNNRNMGK